jgi:signal peptidase I
MGETKKPKSKRSFWIELPILVLVAILVAVVVRTFLIQTFYIPSESMENTLLINDRVLVNKVVYDMREPRRGEVVVFKPPANWNAGPNKDDYIKRVVGIGGDRVICCDSQGRITVNGKPLTETYLFPGDKPSETEFDVAVPKGRLFMMGDHRSASADSRVHQEFNSGTISLSDVVGRAFVIFWPVNRAGTLSPPGTFSSIPAPRAG